MLGVRVVEERRWGLADPLIVAVLDDTDDLGVWVFARTYPLGDRFVARKVRGGKRLADNRHTLSTGAIRRLEFSAAQDRYAHRLKIPGSDAVDESTRTWRRTTFHLEPRRARITASRQNVGDAARSNTGGGIQLLQHGLGGENHALPRVAARLKLQRGDDAVIEIDSSIHVRQSKERAQKTAVKRRRAPPTRRLGPRPTRAAARAGPSCRGRRPDAVGRRCLSAWLEAPASSRTPCR